MSHFVIVMGGSGSGKNHYINNHPLYKNYKLIDVDAMRADTGTNISNIKPQLTAAFKTGVDVAHPMTGAGNIVAITNKLLLAKENGYETTLVFVDTPLQTAIKRVRTRASSGGHDVPDWKIEKTNLGARENFDAIKDMGLADDVEEVLSETSLINLEKFIF